MPFTASPERRARTLGVRIWTSSIGAAATAAAGGSAASAAAITVVWRLW